MDCRVEPGNSPFSAARSRHNGTSGLEVQQMLIRVRAELVAATKSRQVPWSNSSLLGEVYLAAKDAPASRRHCERQQSRSSTAKCWIAHMGMIGSSRSLDRHR
jgi:uncharacterized caspase-like protein